MFKEFLIIIIIIFFIISSNFFLQNYLKNSSEEFVIKLEEMATNLIKDREHIDYEELNKNISEIENKWYEEERIWMLILLHSDLDEIDMGFKKIYGYIDLKNFGGIYRSVKEIKFLIEYIVEKDKFTIKNIF